MKTTINLLLTGRLTAVLQLMFGKYNEAPMQYNFQPLAILLGHEARQQGSYNA